MEEIEGVLTEIIYQNEVNSYVVGIFETEEEQIGFSFERIYDKIDINSHIIFSPVFDFSPSSSVTIAPAVKLIKDTDIIRCLEKVKSVLKNLKISCLKRA